jgi:hypothetical protein
MSIEVSIYQGDNDFSGFLATFDPEGNCTDHDAQQRAYDLYNAAVEAAIEKAIPGCAITYREYGYERDVEVFSGDSEFSENDSQLEFIIDAVLNDLHNAPEQPWADALA